MAKLTAAKALDRVLLRLDEMAHAKANAEIEAVHSLLDAFRVARDVHERRDATPIRRRRLTLVERVAALAYWAASTPSPDTLIDVHQKLMRSMAGCKIEVTRPDSSSGEPRRTRSGNMLPSR